MTTDDDFATAARRRAEQIVPLDGGEPNLIFRDRRELVEMAEWARAYLAAQEPTDAEVLAARTVMADQMPQSWWGGEQWYRYAQEALAEARATRRGEEKRDG